MYVLLNFVQAPRFGVRYIWLFENSSKPGYYAYQSNYWDVSLCRV